MALFDALAATYDKDFTFTVVGKAQRQQVYDHIDAIISVPKALDILELNCGTGEDALYFASKGHQITATDISAEMLDVVRTKMKSKDEQPNVHLMQLDINELGASFSGKSFDVVFSNFGGLNCLSPDQMEQLSQNLIQLLRPGGLFIAVVMPELCVWESTYFFLKLQFDKVLRRKKTMEAAPISAQIKVPTFYYSPEKLVNLFSSQFNNRLVAPVGFFVPPSYLNAFFKNKPFLIKIFHWLDLRLPKTRFFASASDHFVAFFTLKSTKI